MYNLMECYKILRNNGSLDTLLIKKLQKEKILPHQFASLAYQLCKKDKLNKFESNYLISILKRIPTSTAYLKKIFKKQNVSYLLDTISIPNNNIDGELLYILINTNNNKMLGFNKIHKLINNFISDQIPLEIISLWLMKVCYDGLSLSDVTTLTKIMSDSGEIFDYRNNNRLNYNKIIRRYPSGAISEKTALILPSLISSFHNEYSISSPFIVARSLGFTGGTWDKLKSIPTFHFPEQGDETLNVMRECGVAMSVTKGNFNPADRKLYQLRSATGTIESKELITTSIASKQLCVPADQLLLDIRYGEGSFLKTKMESKEVGSLLLKIIKEGGTNCFTTYTDTIQPTGMSIGNAIEVLESIYIMDNRNNNIFNSTALIEQKKIVIDFFSKLMLKLYPKICYEDWYKKALSKFNSGEVFKSFCQILVSHKVKKEIINQLIEDPLKLLILNENPLVVKSEMSGKLFRLNQRKLGHIVNFNLGAGGNDYLSNFYPYTGIILHKRLYDNINNNEPICSIYYQDSDIENIKFLIPEIRSCFIIN